MLQITVPASEYFDDNTQCFVSTPEQVLKLEHSLISISKWESKWRKPFLSKDVKTSEEVLDYIRCMTLNPNVDPLIYTSLTKKNIDEVNKYINEPMTATWFRESESSSPFGEVITNEIIYYWMISLGIPLECEKWHINRLITLVRVCNAKNSPGKKMNQRQVMDRNRELNEQRKRAMNTKG